MGSDGNILSIMQIFIKKDEDSFYSKLYYSEWRVNDILKEILLDKLSEIASVMLFNKNNIIISFYKFYFFMMILIMLVYFHRHSLIEK